MSRCQWTKNGDGYICEACGYITNNPKTIKICNQHITQVPVQKEPSLLKKAANFTKAAIQHVIQGNPHCSEEVRTQRFNICKSNQCGLFKVYSPDKNIGICAHDDCGCFIRSNGQFLDKLSWADSSCPVGLWTTVEPKNTENPENGV